MNLLLALILIASVSEVFSDKKVLVLSFDGFRSDYYQQDNTPNLWAYRRISAAPKYMKSIFPPKTMATLHSLSTGVYPDKHGVYANEMFDNTGGVKQYDDNYFDDLNPDIVPIWIENRDKGGKSGLMMWPGGEFMYNNNQANFHHKYNEATSWNDRAQIIIKWIVTEQCNLVMAYFEDYPCYNKAGLDDFVKRRINDVDNIIDTIIKDIPDDYDVLILSDHGTSEVPGTNVIDINSVVTESTFQKIVSGPLVFVKVPVLNERQTIYSRLQGEATRLGTFEVYDKDHFKHDWYIKDLIDLNEVIVLVAKPNYTFMEMSKFEQLLATEGLTKDTFVTLEKGYDIDVPDTSALFVGIGPGFKDKEFSDDFIKLIDVYPCLKALLLLKGDASTVQTQNTLSTEMKKLLAPEIVAAYES